MGHQVLHVSISAEPIAVVLGLPISNSIFTSLIVSFFLIIFAIFFRLFFKRTNKPSSLQNFIELIIETLYDFIYSITENKKKTLLFYPLISTFFIFIILNNYVGLLPGVGSIYTEKKSVETMEVSFPEQAMASHQEETEVSIPAEQAHEEHQVTPILRAATADLNTTLALAIISVFMTQVFGVSHLGLAYFKKFFDFSGVMNFIVGILELILEAAKIVSFAFRLFGNIFAGEVLLAVMTYLAAVIVPAPFYALEIFVGFIQALVFTMLSLIFFNLASQSHHQESHETA